MVVFLILLALAVVAYFIFKPKPKPPVTTTTTTVKPPQPTTTLAPTPCQAYCVTNLNNDSDDFYFTNCDGNPDYYSGLPIGESVTIHASVTPNTQGGYSYGLGSCLPTTTLQPQPTTTTTPTTTLSPCQCGKPKIYSVSLIRDSLLRLSFDINGIDCNAITYEYSRNPLGPWNRSTSGISSPHDIDIYDASGTWYFRLIKECKNGCQSEPSDIAIHVY